MLLRNAELILQGLPLQHCEETEMRLMRGHIAETIHRERDSMHIRRRGTSTDDDIVMMEAGDADVGIEKGR